MSLAYHMRDACQRRLAAHAADTAPALSLRLVDGALECIDLARACIERAADPRGHLRSAMLRVRKLPCTLAWAADSALLANLADLSEYICRRLYAAGDDADPRGLAEMCDLLHEIRKAWMTVPDSADMMFDNAGAVARA